MDDIDPLTRNVDNLQDSLTPSTQRPLDSDLVWLDVEQDGKIRDVRLSPAARTLPPDALVAEIVRVHTTAIEESQKAISAAIAMLEADPRLAALTDSKVDALRGSPTLLPNATSPSPASHSTPSYPTPPIASSMSDPTPRTQVVRTPAVPQQPREQPSTRNRQPTREEEEDMDRYYGRKSWLEY